MPDLIRTRFAPSPTGYLHVGGARTALFNYLVARRLGGRFLLRIEDTDQTRNIAGAEAKLQGDLRWLGLDWDEGPGRDGAQANGAEGSYAGPFYQSQRLKRYQQAIQRLLDSGDAYYAFDTAEELDALRAEARLAKRDFRYPRPERFPTADDVERARAAGRPAVVRLKMPPQEWVVDDLVQGAVRFAAADFDDFVIQKSDGWPTYHLAVAVDDADMGVSHVIRGKEHLMNTPRHMALQQLLGLPTPQYAHLPLIFNIDGSKMSKRDKDKAVRQAYQDALAGGAIDADGAQTAAGVDAATFAQWVGKKIQLEDTALLALAERLEVWPPEIDVHDFRRAGYLPEVLVNFLALLGWSAGDDREKFTLDDLAAAFSLERVGKTDARFDRDKLLAFNTDAVAAATPARLLAAWKDYLSVNPASPFNGLDDATLARLLELNAGFRTFADIETKSGALYRPDETLEYDPAAVKKWLLKGEPNGLTTLGALRDVLAAQAEWSTAALEQAVREHGEAHGLGLGKMAQPLRIALTGTTISPSIFETLELVGRARCLARIDQAQRRLSQEQQEI